VQELSGQSHHGYLSLYTEPTPSTAFTPHTHLHNRHPYNITVITTPHGSRSRAAENTPAPRWACRSGIRPRAAMR
jgi:hypothetical protein